VQKSTALVDLEHRHKMLEEKMQDQKDQEKLRQRKADIQGLHLKSYPQEKKMRLEIESAKTSRLSDSELYSELVARFERNDEIGVQSRFQMMMSKYSQSPLADDSLYLAGLQQVGLKNYGLALVYFNRISKEYPYGNKVVAALFAKGAVYRKMNLPALAKGVFKSVTKKYPGSPESFRAQSELRLLN
jgi:TolA-binding protein